MKSIYRLFFVFVIMLSFLLPSKCQAQHATDIVDTGMTVTQQEWQLGVLWWDDYLSVTFQMWNNTEGGIAAYMKVRQVFDKWYDGVSGNHIIAAGTCQTNWTQYDGPYVVFNDTEQDWNQNLTVYSTDIMNYAAAHITGFSKTNDDLVEYHYEYYGYLADPTGHVLVYDGTSSSPHKTSEVAGSGLYDWPCPSPW